MAQKTKAKLEDIARATGVSKMTVSRVLRGGTGFSDATRERVMAEVERLNYLPNRIAATFGSSEASTLIGLCVPRFTSSLFGQLIEAVQTNLAHFGYQVVIGSHDQIPQDEEAWLTSVAAWQPAGLVLTGTRHTPNTLDLIKKLAIPVVEIWDLTTTPLDMAVGFSHYDSGLTMGRHIVSRGYRRIGYVGAMADIETMGRDRQSGFTQALIEADLNLTAEEIQHDRPSFYTGFVGTEMILARNANLDALYFHDDEMAIGGMAYLRKHGIRIRDDIAVAGWGAMEAASILPERLTTTDVPAIKLGKLSAEMLVMRMRGEALHDVHVVPSRLVPGDTV